LSNTQLSVRLSRKIHRFRQQKTIHDYLQRHTVGKLQLGSGGNPLPGWLNTDLDPSGEMVLLDIRQPFPFDNESFAYVYSEHSIEHVSYRHGVHCFKECFRVLQAGGKIRIATPNLAFLVALYNQEKTDCQRRYIDWSMEVFGPGLEVSREAFVINNFFRNWGHEFIYDYAALELALRQAGFVDIRRAEVLESDDPVLRGLESHGRVIPAEFNELETVVAEASKPR
jgi:predicted SAM-dependent methyltransferase